MSGTAMPREPGSRPSSVSPTSARRLLLPLVAVIAVAGSPGVGAQGSRPAAAAAATREEGVRWQSLTPAQRETLAPLEREWPTIDVPRKQKWIALAGRFKSLPPEERARIKARMSEWARLSPAERSLARLRFEEARQLPAPDRSARWQAYQALPPEKRAQLAARAASAASGNADTAAKPARPQTKDSKEAKANLVPNPALSQAPRPVSPTLLQAAPGATTTLITRRPAPPPHQQTGMPKIATTPEFVQGSTLLPRRGPQAAAIAPPAPPTPAAKARPPSPATPATSAAR